MVLSLLLLVGCNDDDTNARFSNDPSLGWIQFTDDSFTAENPTFAISAQLPVVLNAPLNETDLTINYTLVPVSGLDVNSVYSQNTLVVPAGTGGTAVVGGFPTIEFDLLVIPALSEPMVFDVVLESTDRSSVSVGIEGSERPTTSRVTICPQLAINDSGEGLFLGEFAISSSGDAVANLGAGISFGLGTVMITEGPDGPLSRTFDALWLPQIGGVPLTISFDINEDGLIVSSEDFASPVACGGAANAPGGVGIGFGGSDVPSMVPCGDDVFTLNVLEFKVLSGEPEELIGSGGCTTDTGDLDAPVTVILTRV